MLLAQAYFRAVFLCFGSLWYCLKVLNLILFAGSVLDIYVLPILIVFTGSVLYFSAGCKFLCIFIKQSFIVLQERFKTFKKFFLLRLGNAIDLRPS